MTTYNINQILVRKRGDKHRDKKFENREWRRVPDVVEMVLAGKQACRHESSSYEVWPTGRIGPDFLYPQTRFTLDLFTSDLVENEYLFEMYDLDSSKYLIFNKNISINIKKILIFHNKIYIIYIFLDWRHDFERSIPSKWNKYNI